MSKLVLGRIACMGQAAMQYYDKTVDIVNMQKGRTDLVMRWLSGERGPKADALVNHMQRQDIWGMIKQQEDLAWNHITRPPSYVVMDSYSDLVDQEFKSKSEGWSWCTVYTDMKHDEAFSSQYDSIGLANQEVTKKAMADMFTMIKQKYNVPVMYLHFPIKFETREKFINRGLELINILDDMQKTFPFVHSIHLPDDEVTSGGDGDVYHYSQDTFKALAERMRKLPI